MIQAFVGLVGGGKSFCSTRRMMAYMARGGRVATNIRFTGWDEKFQDLDKDSPVRDYLRSIGWEYQPKQYVFIPFDDMVSDALWFKRIPQGQSRDKRTLCVVDEATDLFDTLDGGRLRLDSGYRELFHFLRLSRHAHIDILFVCQDIRSINQRLRGLVGSIWRSTDMRNFKVGIFRFGFPFDVFMLQEFDRSGKNEMSREFVRKDKRIFGCYESETFQRSLGVKWDGVAISSNSGKINNGGKKQMTKFWKFLVLGCLVANGYLVWDSLRPATADDLPPPVVPVDFAIVCSNILFRISQLELYSTNQSFVAKKQIPKRLVLRGQYDFHQCGNLKWIEFDGVDVRMGAPSEWGRVVLIEQYYTICVDDDGNQTTLAPTSLTYDEREKRRRGSYPPVSLQGGDMQPPRRANNLVANGLMGQE